MVHLIIGNRHEYWLEDDYKNHLALADATSSPALTNMFRPYYVCYCY